MHTQLRERIQNEKKVPESVSRIVEELFQSPMISISKLSKKWSLPYNSVKHGVERLVDMGILEEKTGGMRNRIYVCPSLLRIMDHGGA